MKLNLGCGKDIKTGWVNLDSIAKLPGIDICHDLENLPLPFGDNTFDEVLCQSVLEHIDDYIPLLRDIHRILKTGGKLTILVPHFTSKNAYTDPTHIRYFACRTFNFFTEAHSHAYYFDFSFSKIVRIRINFEKNPLYFYNYILNFLVNLNTSTQTIYEDTPLRVFPAFDISYELIK